MASGGNFVIGVTAKIQNTEDLNRQLGNLKLSKKIEVPIKINGDQAIKTIKTFKDAAGNTARQISVFNKNTGEMSSKLLSVSTNVEKTNKVLHPFATSLKDIIKTGAKVAVFSVLASGIMAVKDAFASTLDVIKDFDAALTEFKKVSDLRGSELQAYADQLGEIGAEVGRTTTQMIQASTEFKKGGFSDQDSAKLAKIASLYQNIADSELSAGDSASYIISQMKAFNMTADQAIEIIDKTNEVSNNFAVSSTDISTALTKQSASLASYGNDINQTIALVTAGTEVLTGQAGKVSRGLRTTGANIVKIAQSTKELTFSVDGATQSVKLWNDAGTDIRSTYDILNDISKSWKNMSDVERSALAIQLSGKNQMDVFLSTLTNFNSAQRAYATALGASGSAMKEQEAYAESLQFKLTALKAEFERFVLGDGGISSFIKGVVDAGTALLKFANTDVGQTILMVGALTEALNLLSKAMMNVAQTKAFETFADIGSLSIDALRSAKSIKEVGTTIQATASLTWEAIPAFAKWGVAVAGVTAGVYLLYKAYKVLNPSINDFNEKLNSSKGAYEEAESQAKNLKEQIEANKKAMADLKAQGKLELIDDRQLNNLKNATINLENQLQLQQRIADVKENELRKEARSTRDSTARYEYSKAEIITAGEIPDSATPDSQTPLKLAEGIKKLKPAEAIREITTELGKMQRQLNDNQHLINRYTADIELGKDTTGKYAERVRILRGENVLLYQGYEKNSQILSDVSSTARNIIDIGEDSSGVLQNALDYSNQILGKTVEVTEKNGELVYSVKDINEALEENTDQTGENAETQKSLSDATNDLQKNLKPLQKAMEDYAKNGKVTASSLSDVQEVTDSLGFDFTDLFSKMVNGTATTEDMQDAFDQLATVMVIGSGILDNLTEDNADYIQKLLEEQGVENADIVVKQALADGNSNLASTLLVTISNLKTQAKTMSDTTVTVNGAKIAMDAFVQSVISGNNNPLNCSSSIANLSALEKQAWSTAVAVQYALALEKHQSEGMIDAKAQFYAEHDAQWSADAMIRRMRNSMNSVKASIPTTGGGGTGGSSSGGSGGTAKDPLEEQKKQLEDFQKLHKQILDDRLKYLDHELKQEVISVDEHNDLKKRAYGQYFWALSQMGIDYNQEQNEFLDEQLEWQQKRFEDSIKYEQHLLDRQISALQKTKQAISDEYEEDIDRLQEKRDARDEYYEELIDKNEEAKDAELEAIDEEREAIKKKHNEVIDAIKAEIDALKEEKSANKEAWDEKINRLTEVNEELERQKQLEEKIEALEKAKATRVKVFKNGRFVYTTDRDKVSEAQKALNEYKEKLRQEREKKALQDARDAEQKNYEERITALEKYRDQQDKYYDDIEDRLDEHYDAVNKKYTDLINALKKQKDTEKKYYDEKIKNLQKLKKESEKEYQEMIDDLNEMKDSYTEALEDMENAQNGFLDATKAFHYDYNKSLEENLAAFQAWATGMQQGYQQVQQSAQQMQQGVSESAQQVKKDYEDISQWSNPAEQHEAWVSAGSPSSSSGGSTHNSTSGYVPSGDSSGSAKSTANTYGYGDVVTKKSSTSASFPTHANGISSIGNNEVAVVGENPYKEIVVGSKVNNGVLMGLNKGSGVINSKSTRTLAGLVNSVGGANNLINRNTSVTQTFSFGNLILPNVTDGNSFVRELSQRFNNAAIQYANIRS